MHPSLSFANAQDRRSVLSWKGQRHINGDRRDNHPENIWVFSSQRAHMLYEHYRGRELRGVQQLFRAVAYPVIQEGL